MENKKETKKKGEDESLIPMVILLITIGLGAIGLVYFVMLG
jgi:flagellar basal body-associated protein FliL